MKSIEHSDHATDAEIAAVLDQVAQTAAMADLKLDEHPQLPGMLVGGFDLGGGRSQHVYIAYHGRTPDGEDVIMIMSPCQRVKRGLTGSGLPRGLANELLRRNGRHIFGSFALIPVGKEESLMVVSTQIVQTMEIEELKAHLGFVTFTADAYEAERGRDDF